MILKCVFRNMIVAYCVYSVQAVMGVRGRGYRRKGAIGAVGVTHWITTGSLLSPDVSPLGNKSVFVYTEIDFTFLVFYLCHFTYTDHINYFVGNVPFDPIFSSFLVSVILTGAAQHVI